MSAVSQLDLFPERVRLCTERVEFLGEDAVPETLTGTVLDDFGNGDVLVRFDGPRRIGSSAGCVLLVPRKDLGNAS